MSDLDNIYQCTPRQVREFVLDCFYAGLVPYIIGSPGVGKSSILRSVARQVNLKMIDHRASTSSPEDFTGLPGFTDGEAVFHPFSDLFPLKGRAIPEGYDGWCLFLDEFNSAPKSIQAACYKLVLDRQVGQNELHENVAIALAGNLDTDGAITTQMSTAMKSRVVTLRMRIDHQQWLEDVAWAQDYDHRIIAYLNWKKDALMVFDPDSPNDTFATPRTWEFMNNLIKGKDILDSKIPLYVGTIGAGEAVDFVQFTKVYSKLPSTREIANDPNGVPLPDNAPTRWALVSKLANEVTDENFGPVSQYISRLTIEGRILFFRSVQTRNPSINNHPDFRKSIIAMSQYLNPDEIQLLAA